MMTSPATSTIPISIRFIDAGRRSRFPVNIDSSVCPNLDPRHRAERGLILVGQSERARSKEHCAAAQPRGIVGTLEYVGGRDIAGVVRGCEIRIYAATAIGRQKHCA